eukprot:gene23570-28580_t
MAPEYGKGWWAPVVRTVLLMLTVLTARGQYRAWTRMEGSNVGDYRGWEVSVHPGTGRGVTVHPGTGEVYVTGQAGAALHGESYAGGSSDIILMKYDNVGAIVWTRMVGTTGTDIGYDVSLHPSTGDVYLTGQAAGGSPDIILIKYASNGTRVWSMYEGTTDSSGSDIGHGVSLHPSTGEVYVTGQAAVLVIKVKMLAMV